MRDKAVDRFPDDVNRRENEQRGFDECGEAFDFSVAVEMVGVGGLIGNANGEERDDGGEFRGYR
jgi:hypothetical protein